MSLVSSGIEVRHKGGIHLPELDLWLDPPRGKECAFVSHAHSDHFGRHRWTLCSEATNDIITARYGARPSGSVLTPMFGRPIAFKDFLLTIYPAGHILGSAMLHVTRLADGASLLYTGDFKLRGSRTCATAELPRADTLIMETTFGKPQFIFPPRAEVELSMLEWVDQTIEAGGVPVLLGYSLGKAQELLALLRERIHPVMIHESIHKMNAVFTAHGHRFPEHRLFALEEAAGHVLIMPPNAVKPLREKAACRTAIATGWALLKGAKYRYGADEAFTLSDHADYAELMQCVEIVQPRLIYTVHGSTTEFARDLRAMGLQAWSLVSDEQLEMRL